MIKCDYCKKKAAYNLQSQWHLYTIDDKDNYEDFKEWEGNENNHYCEKHAESMGIV